MVNKTYVFFLDNLRGPIELHQVLGFISIVVLPLGIYIGLKRIQYVRSNPNGFLQSMLYGLSISATSSIVLIIFRMIGLALFENGMESVNNYIDSGVYRNTFIWYMLIGLIASSAIHFIVKRQFKQA